MIRAEIIQGIEWVKQTPSPILIKEHLSLVFKLYKELFGEVCQSCPGKIEGYIRRIKNSRYDTQMTLGISKGEVEPPIDRPTRKAGHLFEVKKGVFIPIFGKTEVYTQSNMTDDIAISLLSNDMANERFFSRKPSRAKILQLIRERKRKEDNSPKQ